MPLSLKRFTTYPCWAPALVSWHTAFTFNLYHLPIQILFGLYLGRASLWIKAPNKAKITFKPATAMTASGYYSLLSVCALLLTVWITTVFIGFHQVKKSQESTVLLEKVAYLQSAARLLPYLEEY